MPQLSTHPLSRTSKRTCGAEPARGSVEGRWKRCEKRRTHLNVDKRVNSAQRKRRSTRLPFSLPSLSATDFQTSTAQFNADCGMKTRTKPSAPCHTVCAKSRRTRRRRTCGHGARVSPPRRRQKTSRERAPWQRERTAHACWSPATSPIAIWLLSLTSLRMRALYRCTNAKCNQTHLEKTVWLLSFPSLPMRVLYRYRDADLFYGLNSYP